uniref:P-type domain-containing protein n=1 Tax=Acanthochromis polyacanthus TaxID=80966 RepID=A0A3Q1EI39_9TELE
VAGNYAWLLLLIVLISLSLQTPTTVSLPLSDQRLPCGSGSVSQPQCLSMGCCFNKSIASWENETICSFISKSLHQHSL